ncbi:amino acid ABC transporter ATP-binding protein, PAAT family [Paenibacillus sp. CF384]|nr:amino acid ABC transporter ATP-binding protein, PAAT family [Paenibacillus sp. CF384]
MIPLLSIRNLTKKFGKQTILHPFNLDLEQGKVLTIIGPSGSGKTTLLRCINALEIPETGSVTLGDRELQFNSKRKPSSTDLIALRQKTGMVFQSFELFPHLTVMQNIIEAPVVVKKTNKSEAIAKAEQLLMKVGLADKANFYPSELSGGQKQRIAIARALAMDPQLLLFDEPTSALDPELVGEVLQVIKQLAAEGMTMVIVTHEMKFAENVADTVLFMEDGKIVEQGPPQQLFHEPLHPRTRIFVSRVNDYVI